MSTACVIGVYNEDETVKAIYSHCDGNPSGAGVTLVQHYTSIEKIEQLLGLGNISILGAEIGRKHAWNDRELIYHEPRDEEGGVYKYHTVLPVDPYTGETIGGERGVWHKHTLPVALKRRQWCSAYYRDWNRKEDEFALPTSNNLLEFTKMVTHYEYAYLYFGGEWWVWDNEVPSRWLRLPAAIRREVRKYYDYAQPRYTAMAEKWEAIYQELPPTALHT